MKQRQSNIGSNNQRSDCFQQIVRTANLYLECSNVLYLQIIILTQTILMKVLQDHRLTAPPTIHPTYNNASKQYSCTLQLVNNFPHSLHFYIASTFGCCLTQTTKTRVINAYSVVVLNFKIKPTNLLGKIPQNLSIFASQYESCELFRINNCYATNTRLSFDGENILNPAIQEILMAEVKSCKKDGNQLKAKGQINKALSKFEQGYQIMRCQKSTINQMIACRLQLKDYEGAIRDIESALLWQIDVPSFLLKKVEIIMQWQDKNVQDKIQIYNHIEQTFEYIKENYGFYHMSPTDKENFSNLAEKFKKYSKVSQGKVNQLLTHLYDKAVKNIAPDSALMKCYKSKENVQNQLKELLLDYKHEQISTPQQVLDPIGYQIMYKPYILPSGSSCEQQTLRNYFTTNGYKDPITRQNINQELVFKNLNLQRYIKEHPDLKIWQKYQFDYLHH